MENTPAATIRPWPLYPWAGDSRAVWNETDRERGPPAAARVCPESHIGPAYEGASWDQEPYVASLVGHPPPQDRSTALGPRK